MVAQKNTFSVLEPALLTTDIPKVEQLHTFARGVTSIGKDESGKSRLLVAVTGNQSSNRISSVVEANCIIHLPEGMTVAQSGMTVDIERMGW